MSHALLGGDQVRQRCYQCFRPQSLCFCDAIPRIDNITDVLILQHVGERFHPFNTARIVRRALRRCSLIANHNRDFSRHDLPLAAQAGLLYPQADAPTLSDIPAADRPSQLVVIDGTWHQAKTIVRDVRQLQSLPCYRLSPSSPGQYRIRREPNAESLSTLEATVAALRALEPDTDGFDQLLQAFRQMVDEQLRHPAGRTAWRAKKTRQIRPRHIPQVLLGTPRQLVVAYGEATPGRPGQTNVAPSPVSWMARRLGNAECFSCRVQQEEPLTSKALEHMRLSPADFDNALGPKEFRAEWNRFLHPDDVLIVYHDRTYQLLQAVQAHQPRCLVLKSIFGKWRSGFRSIEELVAAEQVSPIEPPIASRAQQRLDLAVALVEHLRQRYHDHD